MTSNKDEDDSDRIDWQRATWEGAKREQLRRWSCLTLEEIVAAQEEMAELERQLNRPASRQSPKE